MLDDRYGNPLSTASASARDGYVEACDRMFSGSLNPLQALDSALTADPDFALAHAAKARALQFVADMPGARAAMAQANACQRPVSERERSYLAFYTQVIGGQGDAALDSARQHLTRWPRDAMVLSPCTSVFGLLGFSGRRGRERETAEIMDGLAPHYGDDWWFNMQHAFALDEIGQRSVARRRIERVMAQTPRNAHGAHIRAHVDYEDGEQAASLQLLREWMLSYPRADIMHCHLSWHIALCELEAGNAAGALQVYDDAIAPGHTTSPPINVLTDAAAFLWRAELAGAPRDIVRWQRLRDYSYQTFPRAGIAFVDVHVLLVDAVTGNREGFDARLAQMAERDAKGQLPTGPVVPALGRGFAAFVNEDWTGCINAIEPVLAEHERIGGSRAQRDLIEFTLLKAYLNAGRQADVARYLDYRREGPGPVLVAGC